MPRKCSTNCGLTQRRDEPDDAFALRVAARRERSKERCREHYAANRVERLAYENAKRALPKDHSGACDICGKVPPPRRNGSRGLNQDHRHDNNLVRGYLCHRCNLLLVAFDLRYTDPDLYRALLAWSARGAPVTPTASTAPLRRREPRPHPALFEVARGDEPA